MLLAEYLGLGEQQWRMCGAGAGGSLLSPLGLVSHFSIALQRGRSLFSVHCSIFRRRKNYFKPLLNVFIVLFELSIASWSHGN